MVHGIKLLYHHNLWEQRKEAIEMNLVIDINGIINSAIIAGSNAIVVLFATRGISKVIERKIVKNGKKPEEK